MRLRLLGNRILVRPDKGQEMARGFHLVERWRGPVTTGHVVAVGSKVNWPELKEGMRVLVKPHSGEEFRHEEVSMRLFEPRDVFLVLGSELAEASE